MSTNQITIKHNKHRIHPCPNEKKLALLNMLLSQNSDLSIVVALSDNTLLTKEAITAPNVSVLSDEELVGLPELKCELIISYDLPQTAELYISRLAKTTDSAIVLLDRSEQNNLYHIETLLGRVIKQEIVAGFEYPEQPKMKIAPKPSLKPKNDTKRVERKPFDKPKYDKKPNKFLGKDESGKAKFSGKSGERNHRYDGKPKESVEAPKNVGRKISIKALKPKEPSEPNS